MTIKDKIIYLQDNHFSEWLKTRQEISNDMSDKQSMFCICGKLATGLHESNCKRFKNKITSETVKKLSHLIKK